MVDVLSISIGAWGDRPFSYRSAVQDLGEWHRRFNHVDRFTLVTSSDDLTQAQQQHRTGILLGFQNCSQLERELRNLETFRLANDRSQRPPQPRRVRHRAHAVPRREPNRTPPGSWRGQAGRRPVRPRPAADTSRRSPRSGSAPRACHPPPPTRSRGCSRHWRGRASRGTGHSTASSRRQAGPPARRQRRLGRDLSASGT
ncbi:MAG: membrane dipeptidase, partial [Pseudonocardiaceae bacterium]